MSEKRLTRSMLVPLLSLRKKGWKGMTGHPIDWEKDLNLYSIDVDRRATRRILN